MMQPITLLVVLAAVSQMSSTLRLPVDINANSVQPSALTSANLVREEGLKASELGTKTITPETMRLSEEASHQHKEAKTLTPVVKKAIGEAMWQHIGVNKPVQDEELHSPGKGNSADTLKDTFKIPIAQAAEGSTDWFKGESAPNAAPQSPTDSTFYGRKSTDQSRNKMASSNYENRDIHHHTVWDPNYPPTLPQDDLKRPYPKNIPTITKTERRGLDTGELEKRNLSSEHEVAQELGNDSLGNVGYHQLQINDTITTKEAFEHVNAAIHYSRLLPFAKAEAQPDDSLERTQERIEQVQSLKDAWDVLSDDEKDTLLNEDGVRLKQLVSSHIPLLKFSLPSPPPGVYCGPYEGVPPCL